MTNKNKIKSVVNIVLMSLAFSLITGLLFTNLSLLFVIADQLDISADNYMAMTNWIHTTVIILAPTLLIVGGIYWGLNKLHKKK